MKKVLGLVFMLMFLVSSVQCFGQASSDTATIYIYRLQESMFSGGRGLNVKIFFNDKEITSMMTNTKLCYKFTTTGKVKVKCVGNFAGSPIGSPYVEEFNFEKGKTYHLSISAGSMTGVSGEIPNERFFKKLNDYEFADSMTIIEGK